MVLDCFPLQFSQEASGGTMVEAMVDVRGCDFSKQDLSGKVLSGVMLQVGGQQVEWHSLCGCLTRQPAPFLLHLLVSLL